MLTITLGNAALRDRFKAVSGIEDFVDFLL